MDVEVGRGPTLAVRSLKCTLTLRILFLGRRNDDEMVSNGLAVVLRQSVGRIPSEWSVGPRFPKRKEWGYVVGYICEAVCDNYHMRKGS